jgi:PncC family amidohydrolase
MSICFENEAEFASAMEKEVGELSRIMAEKGAHAAVAESLTGGMIASEIVRVPGVSSWFSEGCVTYTDEAKQRRLLVPASVIAEHTAVSRETARAMAEGMLATANADAAVSATGLAGPGCDELGRPAGLVFIGGATAKGTVTRRLALNGSRMDIRRSAAYEAIKLLKELSKLI